MSEMGGIGPDFLCNISCIHILYNYVLIFSQLVQMTLPAKDVTSSLTEQQTLRVHFALYDNSKLFMASGDSDESGVENRKVVSASLSDHDNGLLDQPLEYRLPRSEVRHELICVPFDGSGHSNNDVDTVGDMDEYVDDGNIRDFHGNAYYVVSEN